MIIIKIIMIILKDGLSNYQSQVIINAFTLDQY